MTTDLLSDLEDQLSKTLSNPHSSSENLLDIQYAALGQFFNHIYYHHNVLIMGAGKIALAAKGRLLTQQHHPPTIYDKQIQNILVGRDFYTLLKTSKRSQKVHKQLKKRFFDFLSREGIIILNFSNNQLEEVKFRRRRDKWALDESFIGQTVDIASIDFDEQDKSADALEPRKTIVRFENGKLWFHPAFSKEIYDDIKLYTDLAQIISKHAFVINDATIKNKLREIKLSPVIARQKQTEAELLQHGWKEHNILPGRTGRNNRVPDHAGIIALHPQRNVIIIAFHGSLNHWDWDSNFDFMPKNSLNVDLSAPSEVSLHKGFAVNFKSVEAIMYQELNHALTTLATHHDILNTWIFVVGHSKGAAIASIASPMIRLWLNGTKFRDANLAAVLFSSPRVYHGSKSRHWVHKVMAKGNILRINVSGDIVPSVPPKVMGFKSIGVLFLDDPFNVRGRMTRLTSQLEKEVSATSHCRNYWLSFHYVCNLRGSKGGEFTPELIVNYEDLNNAFNEANIRLGGRGNLSRSFFESPHHDFETLDSYDANSNRVAPRQFSHF